MGKVKNIFVTDIDEFCTNLEVSLINSGISYVQVGNEFHFNGVIYRFFETSDKTISDEANSAKSRVRHVIVNDIDTFTPVLERALIEQEEKFVKIDNEYHFMDHIFFFHDVTSDYFKERVANKCGSDDIIYIVSPFDIYGRDLRDTLVDKDAILVDGLSILGESLEVEHTSRYDDRLPVKKSHPKYGMKDIRRDNAKIKQKLQNSYARNLRRK